MLFIIIIIIYLLSKHIRNDSKKEVCMSKTYQAHMSTYGRLTRTNKENNLHKLTNSLNTYI